MIRVIKYILISMVIFLFISPPVPAFAQSDSNENNMAFVVYSKTNFYGINVGSSSQELRFRYKQQNRQSVLFIDLFDENQFFTIGAYNNKGLLILVLDNPDSQSKNRISPVVFEERFKKLLFESTNIPGPNAEGYSIAQWIIPNSTILFADNSGNSMVYYSTNNEFYLTEEDENPYLAITYLYPYINFEPDFEYKSLGINHTDLLSEINKFDESFTVDFGIDILTMFQPTIDTPTSILISPHNNLVYVSSGKGTEQIWKFDINGGTVETFAGYDKNHKANIPKLGITTSDLRILNFSNENLTQGIIAIAIAILLIITISVIVFLPRISREIDSNQ